MITGKHPKFTDKAVGIEVRAAGAPPCALRGAGGLVRSEEPGLGSGFLCWW